TMTSTIIDKSKPFFPLAGGADDGWSTEDEATATCFCGAVQLSFPTHGPGFVGSFVCNCSDCHKLTASVHATNFTVMDTHLKHLRGQETLKTYSQSRTVFFKEAGKDNTMRNYFCSVCGSLMYRVGAAFPGMSILRVGSVDDFTLQETKLKPTMEQFTKHRVAWKAPTEGAKQFYEDGLHTQ
ncbi:GFA family protein, partial [Klebsiella pneumoniae]